MSIVADRSISTPGLQHINSALILLQAHAPEELWHLQREIRSIGVNAFACTGANAVACTASFLGRHINLVQPPEQHDVVELAVTLSHEARHHETDAHGNYWVHQHRCIDCGDELQRALDPIYQRDQIVRTKLRVGLGLEPSTAAKVAAVAIGAGLTALVLKALVGRG